jgi:hypothetical protein
LVALRAPTAGWCLARAARLRLETTASTCVARDASTRRRAERGRRSHPVARAVGSPQRAAVYVRHGASDRRAGFVERQLCEAAPLLLVPLRASREPQPSRLSSRGCESGAVTPLGLPVPITECSVRAHRSGRRPPRRGADRRAAPDQAHRDGRGGEDDAGVLAVAAHLPRTVVSVVIFNLLDQAASGCATSSSAPVGCLAARLGGISVARTAPTATTIAPTHSAGTMPLMKVEADW